MLLFPAEPGGADIAANVTYLPPGIADSKDQLTGTLIRFIREGLVNQLNVESEYKGDSFVPCRIHIKAWHSDRPGGFEPTIDDIW